MAFCPNLKMINYWIMKVYFNNFIEIPCSVFKSSLKFLWFLFNVWPGSGSPQMIPPSVRPSSSSVACSPPVPPRTSGPSRVQMSVWPQVSVRTGTTWFWKRRWVRSRWKRIQPACRQPPRPTITPASATAPSAPAGWAKPRPAAAKPRPAARKQVWNTWRQNSGSGSDQEVLDDIREFLPLIVSQTGDQADRIYPGKWTHTWTHTWTLSCFNDVFLWICVWFLVSVWKSREIQAELLRAADQRRPADLRQSCGLQRHPDHQNLDHVTLLGRRPNRLRDKETRRAGFYPLNLMKNNPEGETGRNWSLKVKNKILGFIWLNWAATQTEGIFHPNTEKHKHELSPVFINLNLLICLILTKMPQNKVFKRKSPREK